MANRDIKAPSVGESITEVQVGRWRKADGDFVKAGEVVLEIESDKASVEVVSEISGVLHIQVQQGQTVRIGDKLGYVEEKAASEAPAPQSQKSSEQVKSQAASATTAGAKESMPLSPAVRKLVDETGVSPTSIAGTGKNGRITKGDVLQATQHQGSAVQPSAQAAPQVARSQDPNRPERRVPMSALRQKIAERLVQAQHTAAILTTFNECDMSAVMQLRAQYKDEFKNKYGVSLSFMSFFTRACVEALKAVPAVNGRIEGKEIVYNDYCDIGIAVGTDRGLVVPVLRGAGSMGFVEIEKGIGALAVKARDGKLSIADLSGGTFTISNGGTYGSLLSTPILNPPQSGILGMHKIEDRAVVVNGQIQARPMMYLALSYDHRIIDGKEAVTFLVKVKEGIENPQSLGFSV